MTKDAKNVIAGILIIAQGRMTYTRPYHILCMMLKAYYREWGWVIV